MSISCQIDHNQLKLMYITVIVSNRSREKKAVCPVCGEVFGSDIFPELESKVRSD